MSATASRSAGAGAGAGDGDASLTAAQFAGAPGGVILEAEQADQAEHQGDAVLAGAALGPGQAHRYADVLGRGEDGQRPGTGSPVHRAEGRDAPASRLSPPPS